MSELDPDVLEEFVGIFRGEAVEFGFGELFGMAALAFGFEEAAKGRKLDGDAKAVRCGQSATLLKVAVRFAAGNGIKDFVALGWCKGV